jgi:septum formation protein
MTKRPPAISPRLWLHDAPLLLASASTTRRDMLVSSGVPVDVEPALIDERGMEADLAGLPTNSTIAGVLARAKALEVSRRFPHRLVLGADQTLQCGGASLHKPADRAAAHRQLSSLAGQEHQLTAAFCFARDGLPVSEGTDTARMSMRPLSAAFLDRYLDLAGPSAMASVGSYQLEGLGSQLFASVDGDHFTILGLPLLEVLAALRQLGVLAE